MRDTDLEFIYLSRALELSYAHVHACNFICHLIACYFLCIFWFFIRLWEAKNRYLRRSSWTNAESVLGTDAVDASLVSNGGQVVQPTSPQIA